MSAKNPPKAGSTPSVEVPSTLRSQGRKQDHRRAWLQLPRRERQLVGRREGRTHWTTLFRVSMRVVAGRGDRHRHICFTPPQSVGCGIKYLLPVYGAPSERENARVRAVGRQKPWTKILSVTITGVNNGWDERQRQNDTQNGLVAG